MSQYHLIVLEKRKYKVSKLFQNEVFFALKIFSYDFFHGRLILVFTAVW